MRPVGGDHTDDFPGSLATSAEGTPIFRDYYREAPMNPDPSTAWGKHLDAMTERMLTVFPDIDGFFLDELHWNQFDFAHDDGVSARGNRAACMIGFPVQDATRRICEMAHQRGKAVWANGPNTLEVAHYIDGFMAELSWEWLSTVMYLGIEKPAVLLLPPDLSVSELRDALGAALFAGAQPSVVNKPDISAEHLDLLQRYQVLFRMLRGRKWVLQPYALAVEPEGVRANSFALPNGDFAVTLSRAGDSDYQLKTADGYTSRRDRDVVGAGRAIRLQLRLPGVNEVQLVRLFAAGNPEAPVELPVQHGPDGMSLEIPRIEAGIVRVGPLTGAG